MKERFKTLVGNLAATPHDHIAKAHEALNSLLGKTIALHPCADGMGFYLTAEVTGDYEGLLRLAIGKNKAGGGQWIVPSLTQALDVTIQGVARVA